MNTAPFRTKSTEPPKLRAFGSGNGASFADRAAAFRAPVTPVTPVTSATSAEPVNKVLIAPVDKVLIAPVDKVLTAPVEVPDIVSTNSSTNAASSFSSAPKLSAAAAAAYVPKNARPATNTNTVVLTPDMFPALASKSSSVSKPAEVTVATVVDLFAPKKMSFADVMKKRVAQDAIEAEQLERERLRELARKEREERDLRSLRIQPRRTYYEEDEDKGDYNDEYHEPVVRGYDAGNYGNHEVEDHYEEDHAPPMDEEEWND
jgi:hypothetical protein